MLIAGGGPAGAATAFFLAKAGVDVAVLDRAVFPRSKPCAEYLSPEAARILDLLGALQTLEAGNTTRLTGMTVVAPNGARIRGNFNSSHGYRGYRTFGLGCRRELLDATLLDCARHAGAYVVEGCKVERLLLDSRGAVCGVNTRQSGRAPHDISALLLHAGCRFQDGHGPHASPSCHTSATLKA